MLLAFLCFLTTFNLPWYPYSPPTHSPKSPMVLVVLSFWHDSDEFGWSMLRLLRAIETFPICHYTKWPTTRENFPAFETPYDTRVFVCHQAIPYQTVQPYTRFLPCTEGRCRETWVRVLKKAPQPRRLSRRRTGSRAEPEEKPIFCCCTIMAFGRAERRKKDAGNVFSKRGVLFRSKHSFWRANQSSQRARAICRIPLPMHGTTFPPSPSSRSKKKRKGTKKNRNRWNIGANSLGTEATSFPRFIYLPPLPAGRSTKVGSGKASTLSLDTEWAEFVGLEWNGGFGMGFVWDTIMNELMKGKDGMGERRKVLVTLSMEFNGICFWFHRKVSIWACISFLSSLHSATMPINRWSFDHLFVACYYRC